MNAPTSKTGANLGAPRSVSMHPLFHDLFIAAPPPDGAAGRPSRRRQTLTRTVRRATPSTPTR